MKTKTLFVCQNCGAQSPRWIGKCPSCESWNTYTEENVLSNGPSSKVSSSFLREEPVLLSDIKDIEKKRFVTAINEFDRVMGGGVVPGAVTLIGGDPGIGKSTLSLQVAKALSQKGCKVLYVSGEESVDQTKMRAQRLGNQNQSSLYLVNQVDLTAIVEYINKLSPDVVIVDSIQVMYSQEFPSTPGSVTQVRECAALLTQLAKAKGIGLFIIGHVTKEGMLAGPRVLEHIVDTVLYFEGERYSSFRVLRAVKNRFGSTNEIGVFEMTATGLMEVLNPSEIFLSERPKNTSGSVVVPIIEGTRPFLVEIQGLVSRSSFGMVRQKAQGFDPNRLALLIAVLEKKMGLNLQDKDIFLNIVGGVKVIDPAADLGVSMAIASALLEKPIGFDTVFLGEVGLAAEIRSVSHLALRIKEAERLGFKKCIIPQNNLSLSKNSMHWDSRSSKTQTQTKIECIPVENLKETLNLLK